MKPSDIAITDPLPLTKVFGRVEAEAMAAILIVTLAARGDAWRPVSLDDVTKHAAQLDPVPGWMCNPFLRPSLAELIDRGYARYIEDTEEVAFTDTGLDALRKSPWNRAKPE